VRTVVDWVPDRLLCKRWNVPDPYVGLSVQPQPGHRKSRFERESVADLIGLPPGMPLPSAVAPAVPGAGGGSGTLDDTTPVAPVARPAADLFRSIFDPSSDEED
jgi:G patch domain-containing protein 1